MAESVEGTGPKTMDDFARHLARQEMLSLIDYCLHGKRNEGSDDDA